MEINRKQLRKNARNALKGIYWFMFLFCLLAGMFGVKVGPQINISLNAPVQMAAGNPERQVMPAIEQTGGYSADMNDIADGFREMFADPDFKFATTMFFVIFGVILLFALIIGLVMSIFLINPLTVSFGKLKIAAVIDRNADANNAFFAFKNGYFNIVKGMLLKNVLVFLWSLLFIIPGIIKNYSYMMVPYILAENPNMKPSEAIKLSRSMMKGFKWQTFLLQLSFIGWYILGGLACLVGVLFVNPYYQAAETLLYSELKAYHASLTAKADTKAVPEAAPAVQELQTVETETVETETVEVTDVEIVGDEAAEGSAPGEGMEEEQ